MGVRGSSALLCHGLPRGPPVKCAAVSVSLCGRPYLSSVRPYLSACVAIFVKCAAVSVKCAAVSVKCAAVSVSLCGLPVKCAAVSVKCAAVSRQRSALGPSGKQLLGLELLHSPALFPSMPL